MKYLPTYPRLKCFSCRCRYRIGHISKNCKGKPKCLYCGGDKHDSLSSYPNKNNNPACINCQGEHLATSYECPLIIKHRKILSLAATENIPIIEAERKISQSSTAPRDIVYDYNNFPLLKSGKSAHSDNNNHISDIHIIGSSQYNRFSVLNASGYSNGMPENFPSHNLSSSGPHKNNKQSFSQTVNRTQNNNNVVSRSHKSPQKSEKNNINNSFNVHRKLLYSPNGHLFSTVCNGAGYYTRHNAKPSLEDNNAHHINDRDT